MKHLLACHISVISCALFQRKLRHYSGKTTKLQLGTLSVYRNFGLRPLLLTPWKQENNAKPGIIFTER